MGRSRWYPTSPNTTCAFDGSSPLAVHGQRSAQARHGASHVQCHNRPGEAFQCAAGDRCCGDVCVAAGDVCCANVEGNFFPCQGKGGQCCGNACAAPGSKCCRSPHVERSRWYPVGRNTTCAFEGSSLLAERSELNSEALQHASPVQC